MNEGWGPELWRFALVLIVSLMIGWATGSMALCLFVGTLLYLVWHFTMMARYERWLSRDVLTEPPVSGGLWGELYHHVYRFRVLARKRERKITELLGRFQTSASVLPDAVLVLAADGTIEWMNEAATRWLGLRSPMDIGQRVENLIRTPGFVRFLDARVYREPLVIPSPVSDDGMLLVHIVPYGQDQRLMVARDITRMHKLEIMRRDFVANATHELSTPLTVISGYVETLATRYADDPEFSAPLQQIRQQSERMRRLVEDLLLLSRLEMQRGPSVNGTVNVPAVIDSVVAAARAISGDRGHEFEVDVDRHLYLRGSEQQLYSSFANLLNNAVQYTPDKGRIVLRWYADDRGAHFVVRDNGIGIAAKDIPRLTERFYRVDAGRSREVGGTGLGLAIVKHVLKSHEADLRIESTLGEGSAFACDFPLKNIAPQAKSA